MGYYALLWLLYSLPLALPAFAGCEQLADLTKPSLLQEEIPLFSGGRSTLARDALLQYIENEFPFPGTRKFPHQEINEGLQASKGDLGAFKNPTLIRQLQELDRLTRHTVVSEDQTLYRFFGSYPGMAKELKDGHLYNYGYSSFSKSLSLNPLAQKTVTEVEKGNEKDPGKSALAKLEQRSVWTVLRLHLKKGQPALDVDRYLGGGFEAEMLIQRGAKFRVTRVQATEYHLLVDVELETPAELPSYRQ